MLKAGKDETFSPDFLAMKEVGGTGEARGIYQTHMIEVKYRSNLYRSNLVRYVAQEKKQDDKSDLLPRWSAHRPTRIRFEARASLGSSDWTEFFLLNSGWSRRLGAWAAACLQGSGGFGRSLDGTWNRDVVKSRYVFPQQFCA